MIQGSDNNLYGANCAGGDYAGGTLYKVALNGTGYTVIHNFQFADGTAPTGGLMQGSDGYFYGLTTAGGALKQIILPGGGPLFTPGGTLFKVDAAGANFVRLYTLSKNSIIGQGFLNATSVTFGGVPVTWGKFTVAVYSDNFMTVVVPPGAKTGKVVVQEPYSSPSTVYDFTIFCTSVTCLHHI